MSKDSRKKALDLAFTSLNAMREKVEAMTEDEKHNTQGELETLAEACARISAYVGMRHGFGCGDQGHARAVKEFNKVSKAVHKALGFSIYRPMNF